MRQRYSIRVAIMLLILPMNLIANIIVLKTQKITRIADTDTF